jgi:hypothetical protein
MSQAQDGQAVLAVAVLAEATEEEVVVVVVVVVGAALAVGVSWFFNL